MRSPALNPIQAITERGVSIWLDTLSRELIEDGGLAELMADYAVSGATSNPTIFAKAMIGSDRYDRQLRAALRSGLHDPRGLFLTLALEDVRRAAALMRPLHEAGGGRDGFVSFEVTPDVAYDTDATVAQALELWRRLRAPNTMIKVPATEPGVAAIEELTARGVNVNGRPPPAPALGEHGHQGPRLPRRRLPRTARAAGDDPDRPGAHPARLRRPRRPTRDGAAPPAGRRAGARRRDRPARDHR
jgi:hypothetical protein